MATKDTDDRPVVEQLPAGEETVNKDISRHRRKIIKASAAVVPAIMTLRSGAAAAMASTYNCTARDNKLAQEEITTPEDYVLEASDGILPHDHWVRVPGKRVLQRTRASTSSSIVSRPDPADHTQIPGSALTKMAATIRAT